MLNKNIQNSAKTISDKRTDDDETAEKKLTKLHLTIQKSQQINF
jgi:hypothetical protein